MNNPPTQAWNSVIALGPSLLQVLLYYNSMVSTSISKPETYIFSFVLKDCQRIKAEKKCREVHGSIIRRAYELDVIVCTNLMRLYAGNGLLETA